MKRLISLTLILYVSLAYSQSTYTEKVNDIIFDFVGIKGGSFLMGRNSGNGDEKPIHTVTLSDYYIGKYEVTQAQWETIMGNNPSEFKGDNLPVESIKWKDVQEFLGKLNIKTGKTYRLPTEAEWEYAARGGNKSKGFKYAGSNTLDNVAWYDSNGGSKTHPVGSKLPNELGLYDMSGNVWELCSDWYGDYSSIAQTNPTGQNSGLFKVFRGGSWFINAFYCETETRLNESPKNWAPYKGFRLVLSN